MNNNTADHLADKELVDKVLSGDTHAFGSVVKNTERMVAQILFKMISNPDDRKDMAQDIYLKAYKKLRTFKFQSKLSTWIARISYNTCLDYLRKKKLVLSGDINENEQEEDRLDTIKNRSTGEHDFETDAFITQREMASVLKTEIDKLPPVYKTLITLYHNEELTYEEIGEITGLPEGTIKSYLSRARKTLKNSLLLSYKKEDL